MKGGEIMFNSEELFALSIEILKAKNDLSRLTPSETFYKFVDIYVELKNSNNDVKSDKTKWV